MILKHNLESDETTQIVPRLGTMSNNGLAIDRLHSRVCWSADAIRKYIFMCTSVGNYNNVYYLTRLPPGDTITGYYYLACTINDVQYTI